MPNKILLIEPDYNNKYPPLGLMKISAFHKNRGDEVVFYKGLSKELREQKWDRIYIATLFTFYWSKVIKTIQYYSGSVSRSKDIYVGGVLASLMRDDILSILDVTVIKGLLNQKGLLGISGDDKIDEIPPDYSIINVNSNKLLTYEYPTNNAYIAYSTRGCVRNCQFCSVDSLEPNYLNRIMLKPYIDHVRSTWGEKKDLMLLDNNVLASSKFYKIVQEIKDLGFYCGAKLNNKKRFVDFNQGLDLRLLTKKKLEALSTIALRPLRLAFDNVELQNEYEDKIKLALQYGFTEISSYILYNYCDRPKDLYRRLRLSCELNDKFKCRIYSFPMKYIPCTSKDRKYIGKHWTKRQLRGLQCILNARHGIVPTNPEFFRLAFGKTVQEFLDLIQMPENYIIERGNNIKNGNIDKWSKEYKSLNYQERRLTKKMISGGKGTRYGCTKNKNILQFLDHYKNEIL